MDLKYILRQIIKTYKRHYILATAITLILAIGMSVNITVFMIINAALFRPLPVKEPDKLLSLYDYDIKSRRFGHITYPDYLDLAEYGGSFDSLLANLPNVFRVKIGNRQAQQALGEVVSDNYLDVLGVKPVIGRTFTDYIIDNKSYSPVIISHSFWKNRFNSDPDVIGAYLEINENFFTVIGVMPAKFQGIPLFPGIPTQLWIPFSGLRDIKGIAPDDRERSSVFIIGRLRNDATLSQAQAEMDSRCQWLEKTYPSRENARNCRLFPTNDMRISADPSAISIVRGISLLLQALVAAILLVVILNVVSLFLAWGSSRKHEIAIMMAIGCTRGRILCQLLTESVIMSLIGGILGLFIATFLPGIISNSIPALPMGVEIALDTPVDIRVVSFVFFLCIGAGVIAGLMPALRASNTEPGVLLAESDRQTSFSLKINRLYWIIIPQIGISMILLIPAGLLCGSFMKIRNVYQTPYVKQSAVVSVDFSSSNYSPEKKEHFLSALARETARLQGINSVCVANTFPLSSRNTSKWISTEFADKKQRDSWKYVPGMHVSRGCFETFDIPLLRGRTFDEREDFPNSDSVIISESLARYYWKESNPLNQHLVVNEWDGNWKTLTVVGVVKDMESMRAGRLADGSSLNNVFFLPFSQNNSDLINIIGRGGLPAPLILDRLQRMIYNLDENIIIIENSTMQRYGERNLYITKASIAVLAALSLSGLLLTGIGIYGLMSYSISQRRHEIGIRMAVGAQRKDIILMFLKEGLKVIIPGLLLGNIGAALIMQVILKSSAMRFILIFLPNISLLDPFIFAAASVVIGAGTLLACYIPAIKISFEDPMTAIRQ